MPAKTFITLPALALAGATVLTACAQQEEEAVVYTSPEEQYCVQTGGQYVIRTGKAGSVGVCILPDGQERDAIAYYNENNPG
ncbi:putative hemolysin [Roseobacteraceae bacterium NS-SX3]